MSEDGLLCVDCHLRQAVRKDAHAAATRAVAEVDERFARRVAMSANLHAIMWVTIVILVASSGDGARRVWFGPLVAGVIAVVIGLLRRSRWGFYLALSLDAAGVVGGALWGFANGAPGSIVAPLVPAAFPLAAGSLLWMLRRGFLGTDDD